LKSGWSRGGTIELEEASVVNFVGDETALAGLVGGEIALTLDL
jgi:hypothetical protein